MGKTRVSDFDRSICDGDHDAVSGACPHRVAGDADTGRGGIDALAAIETRIAEAVTGDEAAKCGLCGCPLLNLGAVNVAPDNCPRLHLHDA